MREFKFMYLFYFQIEIIILIYIFPNIYENPPDYCTSKPKKKQLSSIHTNTHKNHVHACICKHTSNMTTKKFPNFALVPNNKIIEHKKTTSWWSARWKKGRTITPPKIHSHSEKPHSYHHTTHHKTNFYISLSCQFTLNIAFKYTLHHKEERCNFFNRKSTEIWMICKLKMLHCFQLCDRCAR